MRQSFITAHSCYLEYRKMRPTGLMLHSTGHANPNAADYISYWNGAGHDGACAHALIDGNTGEAYQTLPFDCEAWHCGGSGNRSYIGVEMCEPSSIRYTGDFTFTCIDKGSAQTTVKRLFASAVRLFSSLCKQYGIDPLTGIVSHREGYAKGLSSNHEDPEHLWNGVELQYTMGDFRRAVKAAMTDESSVAREQVSGTIEVIVSGVEVHDTPDFDEASRNHVHGPVGPGTVKGSQFTVTEKVTLPDGSWMYRIKSGLYITASERYVRFHPDVQTEKAEYDCWTAKVINTDALNVRRTPNGEVAKIRLSALPGIVVTGEEKDADGDTWYRVKIAGAVTGFVWPEYLGR